MAWAETYAKLIAQLKGKNGSYDTRTPKLSAIDMIAAMGIYVPSIVGAIQRISGVCVRSDFASDDGTLKLDINAFNVLGSQIDTIDVQAYVSQTVAPIASAPWKRTPSKLSDEQILKARAAGYTSVPTYEPIRVAEDSPIYDALASLSLFGILDRSAQPEQIQFCRQTIADYQRALDASSSALQVYLTGIASQALCRQFCSALNALGSDLDTLAENPPTTLSQDVRGALDNALNKSKAATQDLANAAGKAAAWVGNAAGEVAGSAAAGFFSKANLLTLAVAGVVAYVAFR